MNGSLGASAYAVHQTQNLGMGLSDAEPVYARSPDPVFCFGDPGQDSSDSGFLSNSFQYQHPSGPLHRASFPSPPPPAAAALRSDLGSNISVLKTLNLRFRCFLDKVHELERRNKALENQLQQALEANNNVRGSGQAQRNGAVHSAPDLLPSSSLVGSACLTRTLLGPTLNSTGSKVGDLDPVGVMDLNSNLSSSIKQGCDGYETRRFSDSVPHQARHPTSIWFHNPAERFNNSWELKVSDRRMTWPYQDGVGVQIDTITPEIRALNNVLAKVKQERDKYKQRWEEEYAVRMDIQERIAELEEDLYMSEMCQDKLALRVKQLKSELNVFKSLMSNNLSELDSKIQEKAMKVDMDICRRIDITARLCDVAQQRNCENMTQIFQQVATPPSTLTRQTKQASFTNKPNIAEDPVSLSESEESKIKEADPCGSTTNPVNEEMQRILNQLHDCEFEDDCDSLAWEETEETLLLWGDFPRCTFAVDTNGEQEESIEEVIKDTESLFKSREMEYQETIDQIELDLATAKSDMNRHLHEYMEMCSMKRGLDVQMETCRRLITQSGDRKSLFPIPVTLGDAVEGEQEKTKASLQSDAMQPESHSDNLSDPSVAHLP